MARTVREPNPTTPQLLRTSTSRSTPHHSPDRTPSAKPRAVLGERNDNTQPRPTTATTATNKPSHFKPTTSPSRLSLSRFIAKSPRRVRIPSSSPMPRLASSPGGSVVMPRYAKGQDETLLMDMEMPGMSMAFDTTDESGAETDTDTEVLPSRARGGLMTPAPPSQEVRIQNHSTSRPQQATKRPRASPAAASTAMRPTLSYTQMPTPPASQNPPMAPDLDAQADLRVSTGSTSNASGGKRVRPRVSTTATPPRRLAASPSHPRAAPSHSPASSVVAAEPSPNPRWRKAPRLSDERARTAVEVVLPTRASASKSPSPEATPRAEAPGKWKGRKGKGRVSFVAPFAGPDLYDEHQHPLETEEANAGQTPAPAPRARTAAPPATAPAANRRRRKSVIMPRTSRKRSLASRELLSRSQTASTSAPLSQMASSQTPAPAPKPAPKSRRASTTATFKTPGRRRTSALSPDFTLHLQETRRMSPRIHEEAPLPSRSTSDSEDFMMLRDGDSEEEDQEVVMRGEVWERPTRDTIRKVTDRALGWRPPTVRKPKPEIKQARARARRDPDSEDEDDAPFEGYDAPVWSEDGSDKEGEGEGEGVGEDTFVGVKGRRAGLGLGMGVASGSGLSLTRHQQQHQEEEGEEEEEEEEMEEPEAGPSGLSGEALAAASPYIPPRRSAVAFSMSPMKPPPPRIISQSPALSMAGGLSSVGRQSSPVLAPSPGGFASSSPFGGADDLPEEYEEGGAGGADDSAEGEADVTVEGQMRDWEQEDWGGRQDEQPAMVFDEEDTFMLPQDQEREEEKEAEVDEELAAEEEDEQEEVEVEHNTVPSPSPPPAPAPVSLAPLPRTTPTPSPSPSPAPAPAPAQSPLANSTTTSRFAFTQQIRSPTPPRPYAPEREAAQRVSTPFVLIRNRQEEEGVEGEDGRADHSPERFGPRSDVGEEDVGEMDGAVEVASDDMSESEEEDDEEQSQDEILHRASRLVSRLSVPLDFTVPTSSDDTSRTTAIATPTRLGVPVSPASSLASRISHMSHVSHGSRASRSASCTPAPEVKIEAASPVAEITPRATREREMSQSPAGKTPSASPRGLSPALGSTRMSLCRSPGASPKPRERSLTPEMPARASLSPAATPRARDASLAPAVESRHRSPRDKTPTPSPGPDPAQRETTPFLAPPESVRSARTPSGSPRMGAGLMVSAFGTPRADETERESTPVAEARTPIASHARTPSRSHAPARMSLFPRPADSPSSRTRSRSRSRSHTPALPPAPAGTTTPAFSPVKVESTTPAESPMQARSRVLTPGRTEMGQLGVPVLTPRRGNSAPASPMAGRTHLVAGGEESERVEEDVEVRGEVEVEESLPLLPVGDVPSPQKEAPPTTEVDSHMEEPADDLDKADAQEIDASFFEAHIPSQTLLQPSLSPFSFSGSSSEQEREQSGRTPSKSPGAFGAARPEGFRESHSPALPRRKSISLPFAEHGDATPGQRDGMVDDEFGGDVTVDGESGAWDLSREGEGSRETVRGREEEEEESEDEEMGERSGGADDEGEEDEEDGEEEEEDGGNEEVEERGKKEVGEKIIIKLVDIGILKVEPGLEDEAISVESAQVNEDTSLESAQAEDEEAELQGDTQRSLAAELSPDSDAHRSPSPAPAEAPTTPAQAPATPAGPSTPLVYPSLAHIPSPLFLAPAPAPAAASASSAFRVEQFFPAPAASSAVASSTVTAPQRDHASSSGSPTSNSILENMPAKRQAPHSKLSQQVLPSSSPAPSHPVDDDEEDPVRSDTEVSPEPEADRSVRVRKPRRSLRDELAAAMGDGDESFDSVVEVTSLDPRAAARAAAILRLNHEYIERGILPSSQDPNSSTPSLRKFTSRIDKRELLHEAELELVAQRRSRSLSTSRASEAGEWVNPARDDLEREMRQARDASVMTFRTEDYPVPGGYMKTPGTAKRLRTHHREHREHRPRAPHADDSRTPTAKSKGQERASTSGKDKTAWGVAEWKRLEKVYRAEKEAWIKDREVKNLPRSPAAASAAPGTPGTPAMPGGLVSWARRATMSFGTPTKPKAAVPEVKAKEWDGGRVVERFLREEGGADGRGEEWDSEIILLRVHAIERRINRLRQKEGGSTDLETPAPKKARTSPKAKRPAAADATFEGHTTMLQTPFVANVPGGVEPPSTIRRVLGFVWGKKAAVPELPAQAEAREAEEGAVEHDEETVGVREKGKGLMREFEAVRDKDMREVQSALPKPVSAAPAPLKPVSRPASIPIPLPTPAPTASALTASTSSSYTYSHSTSSYSYPISSMYTPLSGTRLYPPLDPPLTQRSSAIAKLFPGGVKTAGPPPPRDKGKGREIEGSLQKSRSGSVKDLAKTFEGK